MSWWVHEEFRAGGLVAVLSWAFWVIFSITLHELGHGWAAIRQGDDTPRRFGRMTLNPLVHMGVPSLVMFALIGIAWGAMPVEPSRFRWGRRGRVLVSAAGMTLLATPTADSGYWHFLAGMMVIAVGIGAAGASGTGSTTGIILGGGGTNGITGGATTTSPSPSAGPGPSATTTAGDAALESASGGGCSCRVGAAEAPAAGWALFGLLGLWWKRRRGAPD